MEVSILVGSIIYRLLMVLFLNKVTDGATSVVTL
jgi:hypothetical protein